MGSQMLGANEGSPAVQDACCHVAGSRAVNVSPDSPGRIESSGMHLRPRRPWWKNELWQTAIVLLLVAAYPASAGPACYAFHRGWIGTGTVDAVYGPANDVLLSNTTTGRAFLRYLSWWGVLALNHADPP
jgi:hypothetical protein